MNKDRARILAPVVLAFAIGKTVQVKSPSGTVWEDASDPSFADGYLWRIKPEPREGYVRPNDLHSHVDLCELRDCIHVREITDG